MFNLLKSLFPFSIAVMYCIGFIYDASYLENFGVNHYEFVGGALEYLTIGGMYVLNEYAKNLTIIFLVLSVFAIAYHPIKRRIPKGLLEKNFDPESVPLILISLSSLMLIFILPVIADGKEHAKETLEKHNDYIIIKDVGCMQGSILRYRDSKIVFYNYKLKTVSVYPDSQLLEGGHTANKSKHADAVTCAGV